MAASAVVLLSAVIVSVALAIAARRSGAPVLGRAARIARVVVIVVVAVVAYLAAMVFVTARSTHPGGMAPPAPAAGPVR